MEKMSSREMAMWGIFLVVATTMVFMATRSGGSGDTWEGREAPALALRDAATGEIVDLNELRGEVVVLNIYATWCPPCKMEIPDLAKFHTENEKSKRPVRLFGVVYESGAPAEALAASQKAGTNYPILVGTEPVFQRYGLMSYPTTIVIDSHGRIAERTEGIVDHEMLEAWTKDALAHAGHNHGS